MIASDALARDRALEREVRDHKAAIRRHRTLLRDKATALARHREECRRRGITLIVEGDGTQWREQH